MSEESVMKYVNTTFVNVYLIDRAYGGPEEGGWYFPVGEFIRGSAFRAWDEWHIKKCEKNLQSWCDEQNEGRNSDISSVNSEGEFVVRKESKPGENYPKNMPHYE